MKQGPKTQTGSQHEKDDVDNLENEVEPAREDLISSLVKNTITGDIEDINKDGFSQKAVAATGGHLTLQRQNSAFRYVSLNAPKSVEMLSQSSKGETPIP